MAKKFYNNYNLAFKLNGFIGARIIEDENADGILEKGVFIPLDVNNLCETDKHNVFAYGLVTELAPAMARGGQSHYIAQSVPQEHIDRLQEMGYKVPYLGFMRRTGWHKMPKWGMEEYTPKNARNTDE